MARIRGDNTSNELHGTRLADYILGLAGNDDIDGSAGNDLINAGAGDDEVDGGDGDTPAAAPPPPAQDAPKVRGLEIAATLVLIGYGVAMTVAAAPILRYTSAAATQLLSPDDYVRDVRGTTPQIREP